MQMAYDLWTARRRFDGIRVRTFKSRLTAEGSHDAAV